MICLVVQQQAERQGGHAISLAPTADRPAADF